MAPATSDAATGSIIVVPRADRPADYYEASRTRSREAGRDAATSSATLSQEDYPGDPFGCGWRRGHRLPRHPARRAPATRRRARQSASAVQCVDTAAVSSAANCRYQHVARHRLYDLFAELAPTARELPGVGKSDVNPMLIKIAHEESLVDDARAARPDGQGQADDELRQRSLGGGADRSRYAGSGSGPRSLRAPSRPELVELLDDEALLPAIVFIFSRVGCDAAVRQLLESGVRLTTRVDSGDRAGPGAARCRIVGRRSARAGLRPVRRGLSRGMAAHPRRHVLRLQGVRRRGLRPRPDQGRLRAPRPLAFGIDMPAPVGGTGEAGQVRRRNPCRCHAG